MNGDKIKFTKEIKDNLIGWIQDYFRNNGNEKTIAVVGISGGIDSSVVAALCVEALGKDKVLGVQLPQGIQHDFDIGTKVIDHLGIKQMVYNIGPVIDTMYMQAALFETFAKDLNEVVRFNTPARIRMTVLYMIAAQFGGRVANTCNLSETYVGYDTKWGDNAGDFAPIQMFTKTEVRELAKLLNLPDDIVNKIPEDGMCGLTDEDRFGFTYEQLDAYIRGDEIDYKVMVKIQEMHEKARHKIEAVNIPCFQYPNPLDFIAF